MSYFSWPRTVGELKGLLETLDEALPVTYSMGWHPLEVIVASDEGKDQSVIFREDLDYEERQPKRTLRTCGHAGYIEDGRCDKGHGGN
jgi:hypothetical protein